jgi:hypothetical protein
MWTGPVTMQAGTALAKPPETHDDAPRCLVTSATLAAAGRDARFARLRATNSRVATGSPRRVGDLSLRAGQIVCLLGQELM